MLHKTKTLLLLTLLASLPARAIRKEDFIAELVKEIQPDANILAKSCGLDPFKHVQVSLNALSYNATTALIAQYEKDAPKLVAGAKSAITDMAAECKKTASLGPRMKKSGLVDLEVSFRAPVEVTKPEEAKQNVAMVTLNGSFIMIKLAHSRPVSEVAPAGLTGTQLNNRVR